MGTPPSSSSCSKKECAELRNFALPPPSRINSKCVGCKVRAFKQTGSKSIWWIGYIDAEDMVRSSMRKVKKTD
ncbi:hypothetical protein F2P81_020972 [Scophthalmus maximus]|uniref:Uncharacterized protein n=1 Tax=Scophthalmus maximus TaxID=52904 RepID=A0A6A4S1U1_SCOMX|nr:hypothetical protein F2P81_020972 [Scophthalmus maximus]